MVNSNCAFKGIAGKDSEPNTATAASKYSKQVEEILPANACAKELLIGSSVNTKHLPCF